MGNQYRARCPEAGEGGSSEKEMVDRLKQCRDRLRIRKIWRRSPIWIFRCPWRSDCEIQWLRGALGTVSTGAAARSLV